MATDSMSPDRAHAITRNVFVGLLVVQLFFGAAAVWLIGHRPPPEEVQQHPWGLVIASAVVLVLLAVGGYFGRHRLYHHERREDGAVAPRPYLWGNLAILVPMALMGIVGLLVAVVAGSLFPGLLITLAALIVQVINMPTGDPLEPGRYRTDETPKSA